MSRKPYERGWHLPGWSFSAAIFVAWVATLAWAMYVVQTVPIDEAARAERAVDLLREAGLALALMFGGSSVASAGIAINRRRVESQERVALAPPSEPPPPERVA